MEAPPGEGIGMRGTVDMEMTDSSFSDVGKSAVGICGLDDWASITGRVEDNDCSDTRNAIASQTEEQGRISILDNAG